MIHLGLPVALIVIRYDRLSYSDLRDDLGMVSENGHESLTNKIFLKLLTKIFFSKIEIYEAKKLRVDSL